MHASMAERGGGAIVNQSSAAAWMGAGYYGIAKLAMHAITQSLARELGPHKIRVNAIAPGPTDTEATRTIVPEGILKGLLMQMPLSRMGEVDDMGALLATCAVQLLLSVDNALKVDVPLTLLEGWARGVPVIGLDVPAWREPFAVGADLGLTPGKLVAEWNLVAALEEATREAEVREAWGRDARELARRAFSLEAAAEAYERVYAEA